MIKSLRIFSSLIVLFVFLHSMLFSQDTLVCGLVDHIYDIPPQNRPIIPFSVMQYGNVQVNNDPSNHKQVEITVEHDPTNLDHFVAAWIDYRLGNPRIGVGYTVDGGATWTDRGLISNALTSTHQGDPAIAADKYGNFYLTFIAFENNLTIPQLWFAKSTDGGLTWPDSAMRRIDDDDYYFDDKPWIEVDRTNYSNNIYIAWMFRSGWASQVHFRRSTDGGDTFDSLVIVNDVARRNQVDAMPTVGPNGHVYITWTSGDGTQNQYLHFDKSTDGGVNFGTDKTICEIKMISSQLSPGIKRLERCYTIANSAVNPVSGHIYVTWHNRVDGPQPSEPDSSDVLFVRTTDEGDSWSQPINIMNNGINPSQFQNDQFFPWITVNETGDRISIAYYDRSDFSNNDSMHVKVSTSIDDGLTFTTPVRITDVPSDPGAYPDQYGNFIGDYNEMTVSPSANQPGIVMPLWVDGRNGNWDVFSSPADVEIRLKGILPNNSTLTGKAFIEDNTTVSSGKLLTVKAGASIRVNSSKYLTVNGKLVANGTSSQRITFTSNSFNPMPGDWSGIILNGGGPDTLKYCKLDYATVGMFLVNTFGTSFFDHDTISNCSQTGISVSNTQTSTPSLKLNYSRIRKNTQYGLSVGTARVDLLQSRIDSNGLGTLYDAVYLGAGGKLYMKHTRFNNNGGYGLRVTGSGSYAYVNPDGIQPGNNTLNQNGYGEMYIQNSGGAFIGERVSYQVCVCDQTIVVSPKELPTISTPGGCDPPCYWDTRYANHGGNNNIYNSFSFTGRFINNATTPVVKAQLTYWGSSSAPPSNAFIGNVDRSNHLTSQQSTLGVNVPIAQEETEPDQELIEGNLSWQKSDNVDYIMGDPIIPTADDQQMKYWIYHLISLVDSNTDNGGSDALHFLYDLIGPAGRYRTLTAFDWDNQVREVESSNSSAPLRRLATTYRIQSLMDRGDFLTAIDRANQVFSQNTTDDLWLSTSVQKIVALAAVGNLQEARRTFQNIQYRGKMIDATTIDYISELLNIGPAVVPSEAGIHGPGYDEPITKTNTEIPSKAILHQNYPNPFNPTTTISYLLTEPGHVKLVVYDVLGREVTILVDMVQEAGVKNITFNAETLPSGIYYYKIYTNSISDTRRMMLIR